MKQSKRGDKEWSGAGASGRDDGWPACPPPRKQHHQQPEHSHQQVYELGNDAALHYTGRPACPLRTSIKAAASSSFVAPSL